MQENFRPLDLRVIPEPTREDALDESVTAIAEYINQFPSSERSIELALLIAKAASRLEAAAEPLEASQYHALGFHTLEAAQPSS